MENYELNIYEPLQYNPLTGCFLKNHIPFNKGISMKKWMDGRKIKRVVKCLEIGRVKGNERLAGLNRKQIVGIKDGVLQAFRDAGAAEKYVRSLGIRINRRNINKVCNGTISTFTFGKYTYSYVRKRAGGYRWYFASDVENYKDLINAK